MCLSWQNTSFVATKVWLPWQNFCCNKIMFVATKYRQKFCRDKHMFVATKVLLQQAYFCHNKRHLLPWQNVFDATKVLSWHNYVCHNKYLSRQNFCCKHMQARVCHNKNNTCGSSHQWYCYTHCWNRCTDMFCNYVIFIILNKSQQQQKCE